MQGSRFSSGDLLGAQVLLHRHRVVGAALHGGVVGDDHHLPAADPADAGDDARRGRVAVVQVAGREGAQLQERGCPDRAGVRCVRARTACSAPGAACGLLRSAAPGGGHSFTQLAHQSLMVLAIPCEFLAS